MAEFAGELKNAPHYLDVAANGNGLEKAALTVEALRRMDTANPHIIEIGPGGGAAIDSLTTQLDGTEAAGIQLSLVEKSGIVSASLKTACDGFIERGLGSVAFHATDARHLGVTFPENSADIVVGSAVLHEVYSYGHGYRGLRDTMRSIAGVVRPGGFFAYRDVYAVDGLSIHERTQQSYNQQGWLRFIKHFVPYYLEHAEHPYHRMEDELLIRQDSHVVGIEDMDTASDMLAQGPIGLFREIQRHYITFRDHVWRAGVLGFRPELEGPKSVDWLDIKRGHKRVHYELTKSDLLSPQQRQLLVGMSEEQDGLKILDGDLFDAVSDSVLNTFFAELERGNEKVDDIWCHWLTREGSETYVYMSLGQLLGSMALMSIEATNGQAESVMLPVRDEDAARLPRAYYNRLLHRNLANPLFDGKQLVLFQNTPLDRTEDIEAGLTVLQSHCSNKTLVDLFAHVNRVV